MRFHSLLMSHLPAASLSLFNTTFVTGPKPRSGLLDRKSGTAGVRKVDYRDGLPKISDEPPWAMRYALCFIRAIGPA
jgi:hypothetical protein